MPPDSTVAETGRAGAGGHLSGKVRHEGVNPRVITAEGGLPWLSPAPPGRMAAITAARTHRIVTTCERPRIPAPADKAYAGAGGTFQVPFKRHLGRPLTPRQAAANRAHARLRFPVERAFARLKAWRIFRKDRISPTDSRQSPKPFSPSSGDAEDPY
ncbi:transposase family protein [Streptomyces sp. NPDC051909]|uniref:transposase family protein n=1 Tax=Streptomyces sp. NPDC051909 TaxID=3154944 RepID=UPI00343E1EE3